MAPAVAAGSISEVQEALAELRREHHAAYRTSTLTHIAWVPPEWEPYAREVMATLGERHPSRVLLLFPEDGSERDGFEATPSIACFETDSTAAVYGEVIEIRLHGTAARAPASVVLPLLVPDLPVFLRWRGRPPFGDDVFQQMLAFADRLVVDSAEWPDVPAGYAELAGLLDGTAVSDIAWGRGRPWRGRLAALWPGIGGIERLRVRGPAAESLLLHAWLRSRLGRDPELEHEPAEKIVEVDVDGEPVKPPRWSRDAPADLLSDQLDIFGRDPVYEAALRALATR